MTIFDSIILGLVEGFTEFLPISSTGHLVIVSQLLRIPESAFLSSFIIAIQLGAIASVVLLYWKTLVFDFAVLKRVIVAFLPTAVIGFLLYKILKSYLIENLALIAWMLLIGGIVLILFERWHTGRVREGKPLSEMPYSTAFFIGCIQALAIVPGVSRAGATIVGGMLLGIGRKEIVEFSFLLAIPTMLAATGYDLLKSGSAFATAEWDLIIVGFIVSFIAAYAGVRFLIRFIETHSFTSFGAYRILVGAAVLAFLFNA
ncbi:undecaprenyl-diphosphatase UppP [Candidatus Kaiserbacteria bacterium RIFCSPHIGHO2_01_FULL_56_24]|uniref:Undecaprenyl-diphosphatase n=1 Tax=Candidatus Kaiserbacteria bacterium RIFCSPHIGHO2_01_FULL_56_24 TaxID=1798487 RepID=A0A1F6DEN3_9BACT|nr:MAG: undecaprenyl-diphosphatase UppP [Candidatus Kaiserbacteria bacterium RIFCSPHIGHO2_01_FULL_56_24]